MANATHLVICATGRQGRATVRALSAKGESVVVTSRYPDSPASQGLLALHCVEKVLKADYTDPASVRAAVEESGATRVWFTTDFWSIPWLRRTRAAELQIGKNVVDAIVQANTEGGKVAHVVYSSVCDADAVPEKVQHFWGKADVEEYMATAFAEGSGVTWSVIRPVAFFENVDDKANFNPLTKGVLKFLTRPDAKVKFIACEDIGKASAILLMEPAEYAGKKVDAAGGEHTGLELTAALSQASGTECRYAVAVPRPALRMLMGDLYHMVQRFEEGGYSADVNEFKKLVPDARDGKGYFETLGQWANGEKFAVGS